MDKTPRVVVKFSLTPQGELRGAFFWIDREAGGIAFSAASCNASELVATSDVAGVGYRGKLVVDGASLAGTWTQDKQAFPLTLVKVSPELEWHYRDIAALAPMAATADPAFEVATIKPSADPRKGRRYEWRTRQFRSTNTTVLDLIKFAFALRDRQIQGGPAWMTEEKFDIAAEPDAPGLPSLEQYQAMMRKLLAERFGLRFHRVQQSFPVYALTRAGADLKLTKGDPNFGLDGQISLKQEPEGNTDIRFLSESMAELLGILMNFIEDRQVVDETGLAGRFDFTMRVPTAVLQGPDAGEKAAAFVQGVQPLGLKMVLKKADLPVMVMEKLERPSPN